MNCEIMNRDQRIDDFLLEKLSLEDAEAFEIHLFGCPECLAELHLREQMIKLIKEERVTVVADYPPKRLTQKRLGVIKAIADFLRLQKNVWIYAGAAAVLLIGLFATKILRQKEGQDIYAANFVASHRLESLLPQPSRSSDISVSNVSPANGQNFTGEIAFQWEIKKHDKDFNGPFDLKIMDNKETPIHSARVTGREYHLKARLTPGLYYWTLEDVEAQGETLYLGKFFVKRPKS